MCVYVCVYVHVTDDYLGANGCHVYVTLHPYSVPYFQRAQTYYLGANGYQVLDLAGEQGAEAFAAGTAGMWGTGYRVCGLEGIGCRVCGIGCRV